MNLRAPPARVFDTRGFTMGSWQPAHAREHISPLGPGRRVGLREREGAPTIASSMTTRALSLALRLLTTACAGAALGGLPGCTWMFACPEPWAGVEPVDLGTSADLLSISRGGGYDQLIAVGVGGVVVHYDLDGATLSTPTNVTLRGASHNGVTVVVGDAGTILSSEDRGQTWVARESGVIENLLAITEISLDAGTYLVAIASEQIVYSADFGQTWTLAPSPAGGWGGLRSVFRSGSEVVVVATNGAVWRASNPGGAWLRELVDTGGEPVLAGGRVSGDQFGAFGSGVAVVSPSRLWFRAANADSWAPINASFDGDIRAFGDGFVVTANGVVYDIDENGYVEEIATVDLVAAAITGGWDGFVVVGEGGNAARAEFRECVGGRPWVLDGELVTAKLVRGGAWAGAGEGSGSSSSPLDPGTRELLAAAWARDGQLEHASIASFARVVVELMSLGAPPQLIAGSREAVLDEIEHARRCFALASRYAGNPVGPGPLPIRGGGRGRASLEAIAVAVLEDGCINESVAAAEAAVAAHECRDPWVREVLEQIAADEREHAALAWRTLRWLLEEHRHEVAPALRRRLRTLGSPLLRAGGQAGRSAMTPLQDQLLRAHGRLPADERAVIQHKVHAELIVPLARELLGASVRAQA
jgi:hypothetical protein